MNLLKLFLSINFCLLGLSSSVFAQNENVFKITNLNTQESAPATDLNIFSRHAYVQSKFNIGSDTYVFALPKYKIYQQLNETNTQLSLYKQTEKDTFFAEICHLEFPFAYFHIFAAVSVAEGNKIILKGNENNLLYNWIFTFENNKLHFKEKQLIQNHQSRLCQIDTFINKGNIFEAIEIFNILEPSYRTKNKTSFSSRIFLKSYETAHKKEKGVTYDFAFMNFKIAYNFDICNILSSSDFLNSRYHQYIHIDTLKSALIAYTKMAVNLKNKEGFYAAKTLSSLDSTNEKFCLIMAETADYFAFNKEALTAYLHYKQLRKSNKKFVGLKTRYKIFSLKRKLKKTK